MLPPPSECPRCQEDRLIEAVGGAYFCNVCGQSWTVVEPFPLEADVTPASEGRRSATVLDVNGIQMDDP